MSLSGSPSSSSNTNQGPPAMNPVLQPLYNAGVSGEQAGLAGTPSLPSLYANYPGLAVPGLTSQEQTTLGGFNTLGASGGSNSAINTALGDITGLTGNSATGTPSLGAGLTGQAEQNF